jgi:hypothetical protein
MTRTENWAIPVDHWIFPLFPSFRLSLDVNRFLALEII